MTGIATAGWMVEQVSGYFIASGLDDSDPRRRSHVVHARGVDIAIKGS